MDLIAIQMNCDSLSSLHHINRAQKDELIGKLHQLVGEDEYLHDWNEALYYITGADPVSTAEAARLKLIEYLSC